MQKLTILILPILLIFCAALGVVIYVPHAELVAGFRRIFGTFTLATTGLIMLTGLLATVALFVAFAWFLLYAREARRAVTADASRRVAQARLEAAQASKAEREANTVITVARPGEQVYITEIEPNTVTRPLHLSPGPVNGSQPDDFITGDWRPWTLFNTAHATAKKPGLNPPGGPQPGALPGPAWPERVDLLDLLPHGRGSLRNIILGVRVDPASGQLKPVSAPMWRLVHIAGGGVTDSGKSNLGRAIAYQVVTAEENVRLVLTDLKRQTFKPFRETDRLLFPLITRADDFLAVLSELQAETDRRFKLFEPHLTVETLPDYNRLAAEPLPYIIVFVDEVSNVFMSKKAQRRFLKLIRVSRAAGLYFICLGQSWSHQVLKVDIRKEFRTAIHFATRDASSSRMLLNDPAAVEIEQQGRAYAALPFGLEKEIIELLAPYLDLETAAKALSTLTTGPASGPARSIPAAPEPEPDKAAPTPKQQQVLDMWDAGERTESVIAAKVYSHNGGRQIELVRNTLQKFGRI